MLFADVIALLTVAAAKRMRPCGRCPRSPRRSSAAAPGTRRSGPDLHRRPGRARDEDWRWGLSSRLQRGAGYDRRCGARHSAVEVTNRGSEIGQTVGRTLARWLISPSRRARRPPSREPPESAAEDAALAVAIHVLVQRSARRPHGAPILPTGSGRTRRQTEARARRDLDRLPKKCAVTGTTTPLASWVT